MKFTLSESWSQATISFKTTRMCFCSIVLHSLFITSPSSPQKHIHSLAQGSKAAYWACLLKKVKVFLFSVTWVPLELLLYNPSNFTLLSFQDSLGGGFDSSQALVGELSQLGLWDRVLSSSQVASLTRCGKVTQGSVAPWSENGVEVHGGATKDPGEPCSKHNRSSQWPMERICERGNWKKGEGRVKVLAISRWWASV